MYLPTTPPPASQNAPVPVLPAPSLHQLIPTLSCGLWVLLGCVWA
ncbi:hypothetical protein E2C01_097109 [Portunus trituberculatus]|uniref:Uncharacterized protein n=1 Tax=Portunus trituberculatus TaxID=210409 RepID=A0A5B7KAB4_PORTR|nr:hypothetical protein [Portunus trituberculatus]